LCVNERCPGNEVSEILDTSSFYEEKDEYSLFQEGLERLLTPEELAIVMNAGHMCTHKGAYNDDARHYEFQEMLAYQQLLLMHEQRGK
jgi:hypothetical protein